MPTNIYQQLATLGRLGYMPAPGTVGTLAALPVVWLARTYITHDLIYFGLCLALLLSAHWVLQQADRLNSFAITDDPRIIIDEFVGFFWTVIFWPVSRAVATSMSGPAGIIGATGVGYQYWLLSFLLFRILDITKLWPINLLERLPGSWGVLLDDVGAAVVTNMLLILVM